MALKKRILVSVSNDVATDQRVIRTCRAIQEKGFEVVVLGRKLKNSLPVSQLPFEVIRFSLPVNKGVAFYLFLNIRLFIYLLFNRADILWSNDLDTLLPNYLASVIKRKPLIYDTHEIFCEVPELVHRPFKQKIWRTVENWIFPRLKRVLTVNGSIAAHYSEKFGVPIKVARNISVLPSIIPANRKDVLGDHTGPVLILQGAGINIDRGGEEAVRAMQYLPGYKLLIVGSGDAMPVLKEITEKENLTDRVIFAGRKPYAELLGYTLLADIGLSLDKDTNLNYRYSLPNKIFDYLHCGLCIVGSDLPEVKGIVEGYGIGKIVAGHSPVEIARTIEETFREKKEGHFLSGIGKAGKELTWEKEKRSVFELLEGL